MRKRLYEIITPHQKNDKISKAYDFFMMFVILVSFVPLAFKTSSVVLGAIDNITTLIFCADYIAGWVTADFMIKKKGWSFLLYPITPLAIFDILCILPGFNLLSKSYRLLKLYRLFRTLKFFQYSQSFGIIVKVIKKQRRALLTVTALALGYIFISALIVFNVEPETFPEFFDAVYWAVESLTTVGYGDIYPISTAGRVITMFSSIIGIAIVALPTGVISAGYMKEIGEIGGKKEEESSPQKEEKEPT